MGHPTWEKASGKFNLLIATRREFRVWWKRLNLSGFSSFFFFKKTRACVSRVTSLSQGVQRKNPKKGPAQLTPPESLILSRQLTKANFFLDQKTNPKKKTPINHPTGDATCCKPGDFLVTTGTPHFRRIGSAFFTKAELNRNGRQPRLTDDWLENGAGKTNFPQPTPIPSQ